MPILTQMQESSENLEPMLIGDSAFSKRGKQAEVAKLGKGKRDVNLGAIPKGHIASH